MHATSVSSSFSALQDDLKAIVGKQLVPVARMDVNAERFLDRFQFRKIFLARFEIDSLEAHGEESMVRRIVHAHLVGPEAEDALYRSLLASLSTFPDPWAATSDQSIFQPDIAKITTASQRNSHLVAATAGRAGVIKALQQLNANLKTLRVEKTEREAQEQSGGSDLSTLRAKIKDRQARVDEMQIKLTRFDALIQVLTAIEERLMATKSRVMAEKRDRQNALNGSDDSSNGRRFGVNKNVRRNSQTWGKAVEKQGKEALEACLGEWKQGQVQQGRSTGRDPFVLTGVTLQSLHSEAMVALRHDIVQRHAPLYDCTLWPKAELDALVVAPAPEDPRRLQVVLAVEMKRSLDEVSVDCLKFHLLLEICRQAAPESLRFSSSPSLHPGAVKSKQLTSKSSKFSTDSGFVLDFSSLRLPDDAVYVTKRGGSIVHAVTKLLFEQVQLVRSKNGGEKVCNDDEEVLRRFYAPDFVWDDEAGRRAAAEQKREMVLDVLFQRFCAHGIHRLRQRLEGVVMVLTGNSLADSSTSPQLGSVMALHVDQSAWKARGNGEQRQA